MSTDQTLDQLDQIPKIPLSEIAIIRHLKAGRKQVEIAAIHGVSKQAVNDYIKRHNDVIQYMNLKDQDLAQLDKLVSIKAKRNINKLLDQEPDKKELIALNAISGTHTDKYRLLSDKSTENVSYQGMINKESEIDNRIKELLDKVDKRLK